MEKTSGIQEEKTDGMQVRTVIFNIFMVVTVEVLYLTSVYSG